MKKKEHKTHEKKHISEKIKIPKKASFNEMLLLENSAAIQKTTTELIVKINALTEQISKLLKIFEQSAVALAEKDVELDNKTLHEKLDKLLEQNKIIAQGVSLMHDRISELPEETKRQESEDLGIFNNEVESRKEIEPTLPVLPPKKENA